MIAKIILYKKSESRKEFMICLTEKGKRGFRTIQVPFTEKEWKYIPERKNRKNELKKVAKGRAGWNEYTANKKWIEEKERKYQDVIDDLIRLNKPFSFNKVFDLVDTPSENKPKTVHELYKARIKELFKEDKHGTAETYQGTFNKLTAFHKKDLLFNELDKDLLMKFRKSMEKEGLSIASISIHLRNIRAIFNYAIKNNMAQQNDYPFKNDDIMKGLKSGMKSRALTKNEVDEIRQIRKKFDEGSDLWNACNYFLFGYVGRGINFQDIARLKWSDVSQGRITYIRYKTRSKIQTESSFSITDEIKEMLTWYRKNNTQLHNPYIFPVLNASHKNEGTIYNRIKKVRKQVNSDLKIIGGLIDSEIELTTYVWRHTFASVAKNKLKVDVSMISEMLGHHDLETTQHYLKQFDDEDKDKAVIGL